MFKDIKDSWKEARGRLLFQQAHESLKNLLQANPAVIVETTAHLVSGYLKVQRRLYNLSEKGRTNLGKELQSVARSHFDLNVSRAYGEWLLGAWLEFEALPGWHARQGHSVISEFLEQLNTQNISPDDLYSAFEGAEKGLREI